jgi:hypothetical protein
VGTLWTSRYAEHRVAGPARARVHCYRVPAMRDDLSRVGCASRSWSLACRNWIVYDLFMLRLVHLLASVMSWPPARWSAYSGVAYFQGVGRLPGCRVPFAMGHRAATICVTVVR